MAKWASIQKCESKFMAKEYLVKLSEIFKIPRAKNSGQCADETVEDTSVEIDIKQENPDDLSHLTSTQDVSENEVKAPPVPPTKELNDDIDQTKDGNDNSLLSTHNTKHSSRRRTRLAARNFQNKMKELLPCLNIKMNKPLPLHGWKYEDWLKEIEDDPYNETVVNVFRNNIDNAK